MPEPVVLLRPAQPAPNAADSVAATEANAQTASADTASPSVAEKSTARRKPKRSRTLALARAAALGSPRWIGRYPRASLAAGLSVAILVATLVLRPGGKDAPVAEIKGQASSSSSATTAKAKEGSNPPARPATAVTKGPDAGPSAAPASPPSPPLPTKDKAGDEPVESPLLASSSTRQEKPVPAGKPEAGSEPGSAPPGVPIAAAAPRSDSAPPLDLHSGASLLTATEPDHAPPLPESREPGGGTSLPVSATPAAAPSSSPGPEPSPSDPLAAAPLLAPEMVNLTAADSGPSQPTAKSKSELEPLGGGPKSAPLPGAGEPLPVQKPTPNAPPVPSPAPPSNTVMTAPTSQAQSKPTPAVSKPETKPEPSAIFDPITPSKSAAAPAASQFPSDSKAAVPKTSVVPVPGPASSVVVPASQGVELSDPKPSAMPAPDAGANVAPKSEPPAVPIPKYEPTPLNKPSELMPGPEPSATSASGVAGADVRSSGIDVPASKPTVPASDHVVTAPTPVAASSAPRTAPDPSSAGWVALPTLGKLNLGREDDVDSVDGDAPGGGSSSGPGAAPGRIRRTRSSDAVVFDEGTSQSQPLASPGAPGTGGAAPGAGRAGRAASSRVQSSLHVVVRNENFWTISQLYYYSGRYYRALWKANEAKCPNIKELRVNDVIVIPAVEDLDPEYIDPPGTPVRLARSTRKDDATDLAESSAPPTPRATRRPLGNDDELDLPISSAASSSRSRLARRVSQSNADADDNDIDEPEVRAAARPRRADLSSTSARRPKYKVRRYDTLRSIARDSLGDSHRADEILELNRDLIKDPTQLVVGQLLEMPADYRGNSRR